MAMDTVHNYYERLVFNEIKEKYNDKVDENQAADMACIALNRISPGTPTFNHAIPLFS